MRVASLFAGCGGSSLGYGAAGFEVAYACDLDDLAADTYELNLPTRVDRRDVREVRGEDVGSVDLLDASPPCQPWSTAGRRRGAADPRDAASEVPRLAAEARPRAVVLENVPGLAAGVARPYLARLLEDLRGAGYLVEARMVDASWHGVPQTRRRLVVVGFRRDLGLSPAIGFPRRLPGRATVARALPGAEALAREERGWSTPAQRPYREGLEWPADRPGPTVTARGLSGSWQACNREHARVVERGRDRPANHRDALALMGFPEGFRFPDRAGEAARWRMAGNAVPPPMARRWGERIADALRRGKEEAP